MTTEVILGAAGGPAEAALSEYRMNLDDDLLAGAAEFLGTTEAEETVKAALRELDQRRRRLEAFDKLCEMGEAGMFDHLLDKRNYRP